MDSLSPTFLTILVYQQSRMLARRLTQACHARPTHRKLTERTSFLGLHTLSYEQYGDKSASKTAVFIHGMLGSKKNMRTPCREFIKANPDYTCLTIDLRGHGLSHNLGGQPTIQECASDLTKLFQSLNIASPQMMVAHSLAGKVALQYLQFCMQQDVPLPHNTWILDSLPGPYGNIGKDVNNSQSVANVVKALDKLSMPTRTDVVNSITELGIALPIAQWLSTSLQQTPCGGVTWVFDLPVAKQLFANFMELDLRSFLEGYEGEGVIHFVRAGRSDKWTPEVLTFFEDIIQQQQWQAAGAGVGVRVGSGEEAYYRNLQLHIMPAAGHWLHSEDLQGLLTIMNAHNVHKEEK